MQFKAEKNGYNKKQIDKYIDVIAVEYGKLQQKYIEISDKNTQIYSILEESKNRAERMQNDHTAKIADYEQRIEQMLNEKSQFEAQVGNQAETQLAHTKHVPVVVNNGKINTGRIVKIAEPAPTVAPAAATPAAESVDMAAVGKALVNAEIMASEIIEKAKLEAETLTAKARREAEIMTQNAQQEAEQMTKEASAQVEHLAKTKARLSGEVKDMETAKTNIMGDIAKIQSALKPFRSKEDIPYELIG